jgi:hypothetical protein
MNQKVRTLGICLAAVFASAAVMAASASAKLPEWGSCEPTAGNTGGKYGNPNCTAPVKKVHGQYLGGYEWTPLSEFDEEGLSATGPYYPDSSPEIQPVPGMTIQLPDGRSITCGALRHETEVQLTGPVSTKRAPLFEFENCTDDKGGECHTAGAFSGDITNDRAWERGIFDEPGTWTGSLRFVEGQGEPSPVVGIRYQAEAEEEEVGVHPRLFQQIVCDDPTDIQAIIIGGHKASETLTAEFSQVNEMRSSYTVTLDQSNGAQLPAKTKLYAQANGGAWETVGIEAAMVFPQMYVHPSRSEDEVEIKATQ